MKLKIDFNQYLIIIPLITLLIACGDLSYIDPAPTSTTENNVPLAQIESAVSMTERSELTISGASSNDSDGSINSYAWNLDIGDYQGDQISLSGAGSTVSLIVGEITESLTVSVDLKVTDNDGNANSTSITVTIDELDVARLPPMPSNAEDTVMGVDTDNDGVRDDIEIAIYERFPLAIDKREVSRMAAKTYNDLLEVGMNGSDVDVTSQAAEIAKMVSCYASSDPFVNREGRTERRMLKALMLNTDDRRQAANNFDQKMSGKVQRSMAVTAADCRLAQN